MERTLHVCGAGAQFVVAHWPHCSDAERVASFGPFVHYLFSAAVARAAHTNEHRNALLQVR